MVQDYYSIQVLSYNNPQLCGTHFMTAQEHDVSAIPQISPGQQERFLDEGSHYGINQNLHENEIQFENESYYNQTFGYGTETNISHFDPSNDVIMQETSNVSAYEPSSASGLKDGSNVSKDEQEEFLEAGGNNKNVHNLFYMVDFHRKLSYNNYHDCFFFEANYGFTILINH